MKTITQVVWNCIAGEVRAKSGGLALLWEKEVSVVVQSYSQRHINAIVEISDNQPAMEIYRVLWIAGNSKKKGGEPPNGWIRDACRCAHSRN